MSSSTSKTVELTVKDKIVELQKKADHNKSEALWSFKIVMLSTLTSPMFVAFGTGDLYGKIIPSILSLIAAGLTAWLQLRKPQNLWKIYRTAQRKIENELELYKFKINEYNSNEADKNLLLNTNKIYLETHLKWVESVPTDKSLNVLSDKGAK
ncbi:MAG: SLATT domain-containing protein [Proteocatella sp.]